MSQRDGWKVPFTSVLRVANRKGLWTLLPERRIFLSLGRKTRADRSGYEALH